MGRYTPGSGVPFTKSTIDRLAGEFDCPQDIIEKFLEIEQEGMGEAFEDYREHRVVAETEGLLVCLSEDSHRQEAEDVRDVYRGDLPDHADDRLAELLSTAHRKRIKSDKLYSITGFDSQEMSGVLSSNTPRVIQKPDSARPSFEDLDAEYRIQYERGYEAPYHFVAKGVATVSGDLGDLRVHQTYRALPDGNSDRDSDVIHVETESEHTGCSILVDESTEEFSTAGGDVLPEAPHPIADRAKKLRTWVCEHFMDTIPTAYGLVEEAIPICEACGAHPDEYVYVTPRQTRRFDPSDDDTLCSLCYTDILAEITTLSEQEAEVVALKDSRLSQEKISEIMGRSTSHIGTVMGRVRSKQEEAHQTADILDSIK